MIQLVGLLWGMALVFAIIGYIRGLSREVIATSGIILGLFALFQFDDVIRGTLLANVPNDQKFWVQSALFLAIVYFAYQTRTFTRRELAQRAEGRDNLQSSVLGGIVGFINGYLVWGSLWYFMHINNYPLAPYISQPPAGSPSAQAIGTLPLYILAGGPGGTGNLLALAVIVLFIFVLVVI
ncbi:MAG: CvpA family protein [Chloroflexi bacterium]|nr:CvpA family protein [Chloroflexota bacterium]